MAKKHSFRVKPYTLVISLIILGGLAYSLYKIVPRNLVSPEVAPIDVISSLEYGPVELDGYVQKDAPLGDTGKYLLVTTNNNYVELIVNGNLDPLVGNQVHVTGVLNPAEEENGKPLLQVVTMETN